MNSPDDDAVAVQPAFDELGRLTFADHSLESVLQRVTALATRVLPGEPVTSVTIVSRGRPSTAASSGELALALDETQYQLGSGPCLAAASTGRPSEIVDTRAPSEWPQFAAVAAGHGCGSVLSFPLRTHERVPGSLNVYARRFTVSDARTRDLVSRFAAYAVVPMSNMYLYESAVERAEHLEKALDSAFQALTRVSMESNTKVRDVAHRFVQSGELPSG